MSGAVAIVAFVVALVVAVLIHELGHLLTAKWFGMRADRYFAGFGPTLWSTRRGETEYGFKAVPLGGFVSIRGMSPLDERRAPLMDELFAPEALTIDRQQQAAATDGDASEQPNVVAATWDRLEKALAERGTPRDIAERIVRRTRVTVPEGTTVAQARTVLTEVLVTEVGEPARTGDVAHRLLLGDQGRFFHDRPAWQRAIVLVTGPASHLLIAFGLLLGAYLLIAQPTGGVTSEVAGILEDSAAQEAGLRVGDRVVGVATVTSEDFSVLRDEIRARPGQTTVIHIVRDGTRLSLPLVPDQTSDPATGETIGLAGFEPAWELATLSPAEAARRAAVGDELAPQGGVWPMIGGAFDGMVRVFSPEGLQGLVTQATGQQERDVEGAVSLVGAASLAGQAADNEAGGMLSFLVLLAFINVFFFLFNMVPLPPFDGGHLAVLGIERSVNAVRRGLGRSTDFTVDPRAIALVMVPVLAVLGLVLITTLWMDITDPIRIG